MNMLLTAAVSVAGRPILALRAGTGLSSTAWHSSSAGTGPGPNPSSTLTGTA